MKASNIPPDIKAMNWCVAAVTEASELIIALMALYDEINQGDEVGAATKVNVDNRIRSLTAYIEDIRRFLK